METNGVWTWVSADKLWRIQLFWPQIGINTNLHGRLFFALDTVFRLYWKPTYRGGGFCLFGFGIGADWRPETAKWHAKKSQE